MAYLFNHSELSTEVWAPLSLHAHLSIPLPTLLAVCDIVPCPPSVIRVWCCFIVSTVETFGRWCPCARLCSHLTKRCSLLNDSMYNYWGLQEISRCLFSGRTSKTATLRQRQCSLTPSLHSVNDKAMTFPEWRQSWTRGMLGPIAYQFERCITVISVILLLLFQ